ncbi:hypothetical protein HBA54_24425 [Pelagibius litoralis]|uniref:Uncharacterized protein n=1 Tax=Pelagibius litoralis TaxID=374515 RepID=A0A967KG19_9PROT|nr:hypothetical protein [Pelagibius litoralis]NIA71745.1 hypothetical protein [Pelagibius litoralis]
MAEITAHYSPASALTLFVAEGRILADDLVAAIETHYGANPTSITIWDLWKADLSELDMPALTRVSDCARNFSKNRENPRTVFVVKREQEKLLIKLYKKISEVRGSPTSYELYPSVATAYEGLGLADPFKEQRKRA